MMGSFLAMFSFIKVNLKFPRLKQPVPKDMLLQYLIFGTMPRPIFNHIFPGSTFRLARSLKFSEQGQLIARNILMKCLFLGQWLEHIDPF